MKIILAATPAAGHVNPLLGIAKLLVDHRHEVTFLTGSNFKDRVATIGARHVSLPEAIDFDFSDMEAALPERGALHGLDRVRFDFERIFIGPLIEQHQALSALISSFGADVVIVDHLFLGALPTMLMPRETRPFFAACGLTFLPLPRADGMPHGPAIPFNETVEEDGGDLELFPADGMAVMGLIQASFERAMKEAGAPAKGDPMSAAAIFADAYWQAGVPELEYPLKEQSANLAFIGRWPTVASEVSIPDWFESLDDGRLLVLVTQGTVANADLEQLVLPTMRSLAYCKDIIVIGTTGGRKPPAGLILPQNARLAEYLPFDHVLSRFHVVVTNGGYGTVAQVLAEGIPLVVAGDSEDKPEIAARVKRSGAGLDLRTARPSEEQLFNAVTRALDDATIRGRAKTLRVSFQRHNAEEIICSTLSRIPRSI